MKSRLVWMVLLCLLSACEKDQQRVDFNALMGAHTAAWQFVETEEDDENIAFFKELFEKRVLDQPKERRENGIPRLIHWIWFGPHPFPKKSVKNIASWIKHHPGWEFKFWTDRERKAPHPHMKLCSISDLQLSYLTKEFASSDNYGEQSNLLRYEILYKEGGLYVDHDVKCLKNLEELHPNHALYCALEPLKQGAMSSSVMVANNLIGSAPYHPILKKTIENVATKWDEIAQLYPGKDRDSLIYRVTHRSFLPFHNAIKMAGINQTDTHVVFPAAYFNLIEDQPTGYADHSNAATWLFETESRLERNIKSRLTSLLRRNNQLFLFNALILSASLFLFTTLFLQLRNIRRFIKSG